MQKPTLRAKPTKLELVHPSDGKCNWVLDIVGFDSVPVRNCIKEVAAARASKLGTNAPITVESLTADQEADATIAASAVVGWNDEFANADESIGPFKPETALALMLDPEINWIREQVSACLRERASFFRSGSKTSN